MRLNATKLCIALLAASLSISSGLAQKVQVGYDKGVDFSRYTSYTWAAPTMPPARPHLYLTVVGSIDHSLQSKGLKRLENNGDLILGIAGGVDFGLNQAAASPILGTYGGIPPAADATMWTGAAAANLMAPSIPEGALMISFVERSTNKIVWNGTVTEKLDVERKTESLELADKAVTKLLKEFPPKKK